MLKARCVHVTTSQLPLSLPLPNSYHSLIRKIRGTIKVTSGDNHTGIAGDRRMHFMTARCNYFSCWLCFPLKGTQKKKLVRKKEPLASSWAVVSNAAH